MLSKLSAFVRANRMIEPGDTVICALSGGADSVALTFAMKLLSEIWDFRVAAAHFNHHLRGEESQRDEDFVKQFCRDFEIPLYCGGGEITAGEKGLEAAARDARYAFLKSLPGKIATAHTADDNAETLLMHLVRGTGLRGLGGITPVMGKLIRPMLTVTRRDVEAFLEEYSLQHIEDSSNGSDDFLRNRLRHEVMPVLCRENPRFSENLTAMAQNLRQEESFLSDCLEENLPPVSRLRQLHPALRRRYVERFLKQSGVKEPEQTHISQTEALLFAENPSARVNLPGGVTVCREYDTLVRRESRPALASAVLTCPGVWSNGEYTIEAFFATESRLTTELFTVNPQGTMVVRSRQPGDRMRLSGGSKELKKIMIDRKIPEARRNSIPVIADAEGVLGVAGIGANLSRTGDAVCLKITHTNQEAQK